MCMLLANMAKSDSIERIITSKQDVPLGLSTSKLAIDQLMDCFVKGAKGSWNPKADYDYLAYLFADLAKVIISAFQFPLAISRVLPPNFSRSFLVYYPNHLTNTQFPSGAKYLTHPQPYDNLTPLSKLLPFTPQSTSLPRRLGVSTALKNVSLHPTTHSNILHPPLSIYPYLLLPLAAGTDTYTPDETEKLPDDLQFLEPENKRDSDVKVLKMYLEALLLLCTEREGRDMLRDMGGYYVVRECHLAVEDEGVREGCERLVQVLMRDEEGEEGREVNVRERLGRGEVVRGGGDEEPAGRMVTQADLEESDEDEKVVEIF